MLSAIPPTVVAPVGLVLGAIALVWALLAYRSQRRFLAKSHSAIAVVQSMRAERFASNRGGTMYFPILQFTTAAGVPVTTESKTTQSGLRVGQQVQILYDPDNPQNVEINSFWSHWAVVAVAISFAVILLLSAAGALIAIYASSGGSLHG